MYDMLIRGGIVVTPTGIKKMDVGITNGRISGLFLDSNSLSAKKEMKAFGKYILPGGIDVHVHMDDLGAEDVEDWMHGSLAAAAGGITTVVDMPIDNVPPTVDKRTMKEKLKRIYGKSYVDYLLWGGLTAKNLQCIPGMLDEGAVGIKAFLVDCGMEGFQKVTDGVLLEAMKIAEKGNFPIMIHAENDELNQYYTEKYNTSTNWADWSNMHPEIGELEAVCKCILFAENTGARIHIAHVSSVKTVALIEEAKKRGVRITCETCPHYLLFSDQDYDEKGELLKCAPPVRDAKNRSALWESLRREQIDIISSDHSPGVRKETIQRISEIWSGISSIQNTILALYSEGVCKDRISLECLAKVCASNPAKMLGIEAEKGSIEVGKDADLIILDPKKDTVFDKEEMKMKIKRSVYDHFHFHGRIEKVFLRGKEVKEGMPTGRYLNRWMHENKLGMAYNKKRLEKY